MTKMPLRRRNSIAALSAIPVRLTLPRHASASFTAATSSPAAATSSSSSSEGDFDSLAMKPTPSYISLKDLISGGGGGAAHSPTAATPVGSEISIRNRLVKQAAWAYLQPMSTSPEFAADSFFRRIAAAVLESPLLSRIRSAFDWALRPFRLCFQ